MLIPDVTTLTAWKLGFKREIATPVNAKQQSFDESTFPTIGITSNFLLITSICLGYLCYAGQF